jgi:hypothetical protein
LSRKRICHLCHARGKMRSYCVPKSRKCQAVGNVPGLDGEFPISLPRKIQCGVQTTDNPSVDHLSKMNADKGKLGVRNGIEQMLDQSSPRFWQTVKFAAKRHDAVIDPHPAECSALFICIPSLIMASAFLARRSLTRMDLALAVHVNGLGFWFRCWIHSAIAVSISATLWKVPRLMRCRVSARRRSTMLSQEQDVGVKCSLKR